MVTLTEEMIIARTKMSNLEAITKLNCWGSQLNDVSILRKVKNVTVLSLSVNNINSLEVFQFCTKLQDLFIRKNNIEDLNQVCYLQSLPQLKWLYLDENPCATKDEAYRLAVIRALPRLEKLDDLFVDPSEVEKAQRYGRQLLHPDQQQEYYSGSEDEEYVYRPEQTAEKKRSPSPENEYIQRDRINYSPEPSHPPAQKNKEFNYHNEDQVYTNEVIGDSRKVYSEPQLQNHRQNHRDSHVFSSDGIPEPREYEPPQQALLNHRQSYNYDDEVPLRQQNHRTQPALPRSRTTDGELSHLSCPSCCNMAQHNLLQRRPNERRTNVLNAVLCLVKELDYPNLEVVQMAVKCRMEELCGEM